MNAIWKYAINPETTVEIPRGARVLALQVQDDQPTIWALVDPEQPKVERRFVAIATGQEFSEAGLSYIDTFQLRNGLVFHVFETMP